MATASATDYGVDVSTYPDLDAQFSLCKGLDGLAQSVWRRLQTAPGALPFYPDEGIDVREYLHEGVSMATLVALRNDVESEVMRDERVRRCAVDLEAYDDTLKMSVRVEAMTGEAFTLVAKVGKMDFSLIGVSG